VTVQDNSGQMRAPVDGKVTVLSTDKVLWDNCARLYKLGGR
jgi:hypothetical protein